MEKLQNTQLFSVQLLFTICRHSIEFTRHFWLYSIYTKERVANTISFNKKQRFPAIISKLHTYVILHNEQDWQMVAFRLVYS